MKLIYEKLTLGSEEGFTFKEIRTRNFSCPWHFHPECELILTLRFEGYRMVGDHLMALLPGDLVLIGSNLPHIWQCDESKEGRSAPVHILLAQFDDGFLGKDFWRVAATHPLRQLLKRAAVGLQFPRETAGRVAGWMEEMRECGGLRRMALFLTVLEALASCSDCRPAASPGYSAELNPFNQERMNRVFQHINERLDQPIALREAARCAALSEGAFSRFFHLHSGRTFPEFVNQLRISRACRMLA
jgi:AraC-like DNA-binding protein